MPADPWSGIRDATQDGNQCYQRDMITNAYQGSEDCLFLNVFSKKVSLKLECYNSYQKSIDNFLYHIDFRKSTFETSPCFHTRRSIHHGVQ